MSDGVTMNGLVGEVDTNQNEIQKIPHKGMLKGNHLPMRNSTVFPA